MGTIAAVAMAAGAAAAPGQCTVTDLGTFDCDVNLDGGGLTFELPDGGSFAFALVAEGEGLGYLIAADAEPGDLPKELGEFTPVDREAGCWANEDAFRFCVLVEQ